MGVGGGSGAIGDRGTNPVLRRLRVFVEWGVLAPVVGNRRGLLLLPPPPLLLASRGRTGCGGQVPRYNPAGLPRWWLVAAQSASGGMRSCYNVHSEVLLVPFPWTLSLCRRDAGMVNEGTSTQNK